jgi:Bacteriocin-protection, YdeI or OmpD-Associated
VLVKELATTIRFQEELLSDKSGTFLAVPNSDTALTVGKVVEGVMVLFPFRVTLSAGSEGLGFVVGSALEKAAGVQVGDLVSVEITRIGDEPELRVPADLLEGLEAEPAAMAQWLATTPNARREWVRWYVSCKQEQTRQTHFTKAIDMLSKGKKRICCFPGLNWTTKDYPDVDTWVPLPINMKSNKR